MIWIFKVKKSKKKHLHVAFNAQQEVEMFFQSSPGWPALTALTPSLRSFMNMTFKLQTKRKWKISQGL